MQYPIAFIQFGDGPKADQLRQDVSRLAETQGLEWEEAAQEIVSKDAALQFLNEAYAIMGYQIAPYTTYGAAFAQWWANRANQDQVHGYYLQDKENANLAEWAVRLYEQPQNYPVLNTDLVYTPAMPLQNTELSPNMGGNTQTTTTGIVPVAMVSEAAMQATGQLTAPNLDRLTDVEKVALWLMHSEDPVASGTRAVGSVAVNCQDASCEVDYIYKAARNMAQIPGTTEKAEAFLKANPEYAKPRTLPSVASFAKTVKPLEKLAVVVLLVFVGMVLIKAVFKS